MRTKTIGLAFMSAPKFFAAILAVHCEFFCAPAMKILFVIASVVPVCVAH